MGGGAYCLEGGGGGGHYKIDVGNKECDNLCKMKGKSIVKLSPK